MMSFSISGYISSGLKNKSLKDYIQIMGNMLYSVLIFLLVFDPTNTILGLKNHAFVLFVAFNIIFFKPSFRYLPFVLMVYCVVFLNYLLSEMQMNRLDIEMFSGIIKGFSPLLLLLWAPYYNVIKLMKWPVITVCLLFTILYLLVVSNEMIEIFVFNYVKSNGEMIMMTRRTFLGLKVFGMYYKSIISFVFVLFMSYYSMFHGSGNRILNMLIVIILTFTFLVSGTRATMLLPFAMLAMVSYKKIMTYKKLCYFLYPLLCLFVVAFLFIIFKLATQEGEASNAIKYAHLVSYAQLFEQNPLYLIIGQGPATYFYSEGFHRWTSITEWTYLELLRSYGLMSVFIFVLLLFPLYKLSKNIRTDYDFGIMFAYIFYLLIAGTNPLLISSTGMIIILAIYSYIYRIEIKSQIEAVNNKLKK